MKCSTSVHSPVLLFENHHKAKYCTVFGVGDLDTMKEPRLAWWPFNGGYQTGSCLLEIEEMSLRLAVYVVCLCSRMYFGPFRVF